MLAPFSYPTPQSSICQKGTQHYNPNAQLQTKKAESCSHMQGGETCGARAQVYYGDILPPVGSQQISYARFMDLVHRKRVKRIVLMSDGKVAMVEVPVEGYASKLDEARFDRKDEECAARLPQCSHRL